MREMLIKYNRGGGVLLVAILLKWLTVVLAVATGVEPAEHPKGQVTVQPEAMPLGMVLAAVAVEKDTVLLGVAVLAEKAIEALLYCITGNMNKLLIRSKWLLNHFKFGTYNYFIRYFHNLLGRNGKDVWDSSFHQ